jgi:hypothetical protein
MQWLGCAARDPSIEASSIYFVKKDYKRRRGHVGKVHHGKWKARVQQGSPKKVVCLEGAVGNVKQAIMIKGNNRSGTCEQLECHESDISSSESDADEINDTIAPDRNMV